MIEGFKVWGCDVFVSDRHTRAIVFYGQIGKGLQDLRQKTIHFDSNYTAQDYAWESFNKKRGYYIPVCREVYFQFIDERDRLGLIQFLLSEYQHLGFK